jgi:transposase
MSKTFRPWTIDEPLLLPARVQDFVGEGHLARFVLAVVLEHLDLCEIESAYGSERGQPAFDPAMMAALLLYGYCTGVYSSRRIAKAARERVDFMSLVGLDPPDFRTVSEFRKRHLKALAGLFAQVLKLCEQAGLVKLGHVALDGTKIKANASRHKAMSYERMAKRAAELEAEVAKWLSGAEAADAEEDKAFGRDRSGEELPDWVADRTKRAEKIRAAKAELEAEAKAAAEAKAKEQAAAEERRKAEGRKRRGKPPAQPSAEPDPKAQKNFTDPESRIMKTKDGFIQGYNAQAAVDAAAQVIVAHGLDARQSDQHHLAPIADAIKANLGRKPTQLSADAGYCSDANRRAHRRHAREDQGRRPRKPLSLEEATARAGVRTDQAGARLPPVPPTRRRQGRRRMGPRLPRPQHPEARPPEDAGPGRPRTAMSLAPQTRNEQQPESSRFAASKSAA